MNIGIILAAGNSSRFDSETPKQLYQINRKEIIYHSIDILSQSLDETIIVSNSSCCDKIKTDAVVLVNDVNCRLQSIKKALDYIRNKKVSNIIIHDSARPFITKDHIDNLLASSKKFLYSQYYLKLTNWTKVPF
jgi:2-C-methyl-D-erythritol 4-phosphate cytidylyltransferase/2-C-methyl-D-erythritol 2,4-cyclodiphosphate synthase